jgi:hypothetical protein
MKKLVLVIMILFFGIFMASCNIGSLDAKIYGVVINISFEEDAPQQLVVNCVDFGYMFIPDSDHIYGQFAEEYTPDYIIKEGDLLEIWYADARDVEILESYPGQFGKEPDQINVAKQNVSLQKINDDSWLFEFLIDEVSYEYGFEISNKNEGDEIHIWYATIIDKLPSQVALFTTTIETINDDLLSIKIPNDFINDFLMYYSENSIVIHEVAHQ